MCTSFHRLRWLLSFSPILLGVLVACAYSDVSAGTEQVHGRRMANESELTEIAGRYDLTRIPADSHYRVVGVEGTFDGVADGSEGRLTGFVLFEPRVLRGSLCVFEAIVFVGKPQAVGYDWEDPEWIRSYWLIEPGLPCALNDENRPPFRSVRVEGSVPSAQVRDVLLHEEEILAQALDKYDEKLALRQASRGNGNLKMPDLRSNTGTRLESLETSRLLLPGNGFVLRASFTPGSNNAGAVVSFSIDSSGIEVHDTGYLLY